MITEQTWRETVAALLKHIDKETCTHDETHREGAIWETCSQCGATWADDKGGRPEFRWPIAVEAARALLAPEPTEGVTPAEHWHRLYLEECQKHKDHVARLGAEIEGLEASAQSYEAEHYNQQIHIGNEGE